MYCQNCGNPVKGNFCSNCGNKIVPSTNSIQQPSKCNISNSSPKLLPAFGLLLLIWLSSSGQYLNTLEEYNLSQAYILVLGIHLFLQYLCFVIRLYRE